VQFIDKYGPWAVISGASEGVGRAFARQLAERGLNLVLIARREGPLRELADGLTAEFGVECAAASVDLEAPGSSERVAEAVGARDVGLYVSNAGADPHGSRFLDLDLEKWQGLVNRNVTNLMRCCHKFGTAMRTRGRGGIILIGSGACYGGAGHLAVYAGSKAFSLNFAEGLWSELRPHGVDVLYMALNMTDTPELRRLLGSRGQLVPEGIAQPEDVAAQALGSLGAVHLVNWGAADEEPGFAPTSASSRRLRTLAIDAASSKVFGD
jgi:uncharacterized protein